MRIRTSSDWREELPFDTPVPATDVAAGDPARCAGCPADAAPLPRARLWAVKHRHPHNPAGFVRFYCSAHAPRPAAPAPTARRPGSSPRLPRAPRPSVPDRPAALCPDCFVEVPATGVCGMCGQRVA
ncbi:glucose-6-phosphate dehydrogenase [Microbacterium sp.]|uniref:glucose-6-phosphate dehydrogenase n=1 Tax=Microbacterium sp. TaxID=51671 RepID=UPI0039E5C44D